MLLEILDSLFDIRPSWRDEKYDVFCHNLRQQIKLFIDNEEADSQVGKLYAVLCESTSSKKKYLAFLKQLRIILKQDVNSSLSSSMSYVLRSFYNVSMKEFCLSLLLRLVNLNDKQWIETPLSKEEFLPIVEWVYKKLEKLPSKETSRSIFRELFRLQSALSLGFDPIKQSNLPYYLFSLDYKDPNGTTHSFDNLRVGCPTIEPFMFCSGRTSLEYDALMKDYADKGERHLYINLQNRQPPWVNKTFGIHNERVRVKALEDTSQRYQESFLLVTLAKDSSFYNQDGEFEDPKWNNFEVFKGYFLSVMFSQKDSAFSFPKGFSGEDFFLNDLSYLLDELHQEVFFSEKILTLPERKDFIEIFYLRLTYYFLDKVRPKTFNLTCRDCIDRGAASNALLLFHQSQIEGYSFDKDWLLTFLSCTFVPSFFVRKRVMRPSRFKRLLAAMRRLMTYFESNKTPWSGNSIGSFSLNIKD
jgi:hypothetical protein